jgi:hypothetical protein
MNIKAVLMFSLLAASLAAHASADRPTSGKNAFDPKLPQIEVSYTCLNNPEQKIKVTKNLCLKEVKALKSIQCRPDWLQSRKTVDYFECASRYSTGDFKAYYKRKADGTRVMIRQFGAADD